MITVSKLINNFYPVVQLDGGLVRCADELENRTIYTYFLLNSESDNSKFLVSDDIIDDEFADFVLRKGHNESYIKIKKADLEKNRYGFTNLLYVPYQYHSELKGRLDSDRSSATLYVPSFTSEFSGLESPEEFIKLRRDFVPTSMWRREVSPKIILRFENSKTRNSTGEGYIFVNFDQLISEVENLRGVLDGFIEIKNYRDDVIEILSPDEGAVFWIADRNDSKRELVSDEKVRDRLWHFLTQ